TLARLRPESVAARTAFDPPRRAGGIFGYPRRKREALAGRRFGHRRRRENFGLGGSHGRPRFRSRRHDPRSPAGKRVFYSRYGAKDGQAGGLADRVFLPF